MLQIFAVSIIIWMAMPLLSLSWWAISTLTGMPGLSLLEYIAIGVFGMCMSALGILIVTVWDGIK